VRTEYRFFVEKSTYAFIVLTASLKTEKGGAPEERRLFPL
jgi:hypothetical protein